MTVARPRAANIERVFRDASADQYDAGMRWYHDAHEAAVRLDPINPDRAAGVIAALSPQTDWARNLELTRRAYTNGYASGTLGRSIDKANAILAGADPLDVLRGPKTRAFYRLIADPDDLDAVVVDRHAIDIAIGERLTVADRERWYPLERRGWYRIFADAYRAAGRLLGVNPSQVQGVTWTAWTDAWSGVRVAA